MWRWRAAGGTGGHLFPAEALAEQWLKFNQGIELYNSYGLTEIFAYQSFTKVRTPEECRHVEVNSRLNFKQMGKKIGFFIVAIV